MKTTLSAIVITLLALTAAYLQYRDNQSLRNQLTERNSRLAALEQQIGINSARQAQFETQITQLQQNLESSSRQLALLADSLQEAREMLYAPVTPDPAN